MFPDSSDLDLEDTSGDDDIPFEDVVEILPLCSGDHLVSQLIVQLSQSDMVGSSADPMADLDVHLLDGFLVDAPSESSKFTSLLAVPSSLFSDHSLDSLDLSTTFAMANFAASSSSSSSSFVSSASFMSSASSPF